MVLVCFFVCFFGSIVSLGRVRNILDKTIRFCKSVRLLRDIIAIENVSFKEIFHYFSVENFMLLFSDPKIDDGKRRELRDQHSKLRKAIYFYIIMGVVNILFIVFLIIRCCEVFLKKDFSNIAEPVAVLCFEIPFFASFYVSIVLKLLKLNPAACVVEGAFDSWVSLSESIVKNAAYWIINLIVIIVYIEKLYLPFKSYTDDLSKITGTNITIVLAFGAIVIYNNGVLRIIAGLLLRTFYKHQVIEYKEVYDGLRQTTYFILVTLLLYATIRNSAESSFYQSLGISFLYDTYFDHKNKERIKDIEKSISKQI